MSTKQFTKLRFVSIGTLVPKLQTMILTTAGAFANVEYAPEDLIAPTLAAPTASQDLSSSYYYAYNYQRFICLVNSVVEAAWDDLKSQFSNGPLF